MQTAKRLALVALFVLAGSTVLQAQTNNASINVTATVQQPINVTGANTLAFGNVLPGVNSTVGVASASAGRFDVTGELGTPVSLSFVLPASLTDGVNLLPIGTWTGNHNTSNAPTGTGFTPANGPATFAATLDAINGTLFVFIGATVTPAVNQPAGAYAGTIQMTVVY